MKDFTEILRSWKKDIWEDAAMAEYSWTFQGDLPERSLTDKKKCVIETFLVDCVPDLQKEISDFFTSMK